MNCQSCREHLSEHLDGKMTAAADAAVREHLTGCADCRAELASLSKTLRALDSIVDPAPSHRLRASLMGHIETEKLLDSPTRVPFPAARPTPAFPWRRLAFQVLGASALIALGYFAGVRAVHPSQGTGDEATRLEVAELKARMDTMGQLVEQSVLQQRPTADRLETVLTAAASPKSDNRLIDGLINSMAFDPSVNVRLNALNALYERSGNEVVRAGVIACLPRESNPLVQVAMIDFLVATRDREASPELRKLVADPNANPEVRESARRAIDEL